MSYRDIAPIWALEKTIFPSPWSVESFLYRLTDRKFNISFVGSINDELVAYAVSYIVCDELHLANLAVKSTFRRKKIGEILLWFNLQIGKAKKCRWIHLEVREKNKSAIALYEKYDFKIVGVRKNYYAEENENALLLSRIIQSEKNHGLV